MTLFSRFGIQLFRTTRNRRRPVRLTPHPAAIESLEDRTLLAAPTLLTPTPGYTTDSTPAFDWSDVADADEYHLWVNDLNTGESGVIFEANLPTSDFTPMAALTVGHSYIWTAAGIDGGVYDDWAAHQTFTVRPEAPELTGPVELLTESLLLDRTPTLTWSAVAGADHYDVAVNNLTTGEQQVIRNTNVVGTELVSPIELEIGHNYIWSVRAVADTGVASEWAAHKVFTAIPEAPELQIDDTVNSTTPEFNWSAVDGADHYVIWANDLTTGETAVIYDTNVPGTSYTPPVLLDAEHQYLWTVRAVTSTGYGGQWARHDSFYIDDADPAIGSPTLLGPFGHSVDNTPEFRWTEVPGATSYDLIVSSLTTGEYGLIVETGITETSFTVEDALFYNPPSSVLAYTVRAHVNVVHGPYAPAGVFTLDKVAQFTGTGASDGDVDPLEVAMTLMVNDGSGFESEPILVQPTAGPAVFDAAISLILDDFDNPGQIVSFDGSLDLRPYGVVRPGLPGTGFNAGPADLGFWRHDNLTPPAPDADPQVEVALRDIVLGLPSGAVFPLTEENLADHLEQLWSVEEGSVDIYAGEDTGEGTRGAIPGLSFGTVPGDSLTASYTIEPDPVNHQDRHVITFDVNTHYDLSEFIVSNLIALDPSAGVISLGELSLTGTVQVEFTNPVIYLPDPSMVPS